MPDTCARGLRPQRFHDLYALHEAAHALPAGEPKNGLRHMSANANADGKPSLAELIQARDEFGELYGIAQHRQHDRGPQAQARGQRRGIGEEAQGLQHGHMPDDRLLYPQTIIAQGFRFLDKLLNQVYIHCRIAKHLWNSNATRCLACCHDSDLLDEVRGHRCSLVGSILWETCVTKQDTSAALPAMTR